MSAKYYTKDLYPLQDDVLSLVSKIEMINDVAFHEGEIISDRLFHRIDSWKNILSNKISALSRNEPKDMADILFLSDKFDFNWMEVIESAKKKDMWVNEIDISTIFNIFGANTLVESPKVKPDWMKHSQKNYPKVEGGHWFFGFAQGQVAKM